MSPVADNPVIVPDRELEEDKKPGESEPPRIRCPLCGWMPRKDDLWSCHCGHLWNTFDTGDVPSLPAPADFNAVPQVGRPVAAFRLVRGAIAYGESWDLLLARLHILSWPKP